MQTSTAQNRYARPASISPFSSLKDDVVRDLDNEIRSAYSYGPLTIADTDLDKHDSLGSPAGIDETSAHDPRDKPLVVRIEADPGDPELALELLPQEILESIVEFGEFDCLDLAKGLYELGLPRPAISLLERQVRSHGCHLGAHELMGKCLMALDRPDLAVPWLLRPLRDADLDIEAVFELVRLVSLCQLRMGTDEFI